MNKVEPETANKMRRWQSAHIARTHGIDEEIVLSRLPAFTRQDLARQQVGKILEKSVLFSLMPDGLKETTLTFLKHRVFAPGDVLIKQDDIGDEMYFIERGEVEVLVGDTLVAVLGPGDCVGETGVIERSLRTATARARTGCYVFSLGMQDFWYVVNYFPQSKKTLHMLTYTRQNRHLCTAIAKTVRWYLRSDTVSLRVAFKTLLKGFHAHKSACEPKQESCAALPEPAMVKKTTPKLEPIVRNGDTSRLGALTKFEIEAGSVDKEDNRSVLSISQISPENGFHNQNGSHTAIKNGGAETGGTAL